MKQVFLNVRDMLKSIPSINHIDLDKGQLEYTQGRPPVAFPCALIRIEIQRTESLGNGIQQCYGLVTIRLGFDYTGETLDNTPDEVLTSSLEYFDIMQEVYLKFQGKEAISKSSGLFNRASLREETRRDGLKVTPIPFSCSWIDQSAQG